MRGRWPRTSIAMEGVVGDEGGAKREGGRRVVTLTLERKLAMAVPPRHPRRPHAERARRELGGACGRTCFVFVFSVAPGAVVEPAARGMPALFPLRTPPPAPHSTKVSTMGSSGSDAGGGGDWEGGAARRPVGDAAAVVVGPIRRGAGSPQLPPPFVLAPLPPRSKRMNATASCAWKTDKTYGAGSPMSS